jgi:cell division protein FtsB
MNNKEKDYMYKDVMFLTYEKTTAKPSLLVRLRNKVHRINYLLVSAFWLFADPVLNLLERLFKILSNVIKVKVSLFDKGHEALLDELQALDAEVAVLKRRNKRLDSENYLLLDAVHDLKTGGNMCYDKCVQWFGSDCEQALRWRDALNKANASLGFRADEAMEYYTARGNLAWLEEPYKKKEDENRKGRSSSKVRRKKR